MRVNILCVGKLREKCFREGVERYRKLLRPYADLRLIELREEREFARSIPEELKRKEGERLLKEMKSGCFISCSPGGVRMDSVQLAEYLKERIYAGKTPLNFIVGGSYGLSDEVLSRSDLVLSFSDFTFPHQLFSLILSEQIYRSFTIINGKKYHK